MSEEKDLWDQIHALKAELGEVKERIVRIEERSVNRDEKISGIAKNVTEMHEFFLQTKGGIKVASAMKGLAWGVGGSFFTFIISNWEWIKKFLRS